MNRSVISICLLLALASKVFSQEIDTIKTLKVGLKNTAISKSKRIELSESKEFIFFSTFDFITDNIKRHLAEHEVMEDKQLFDKFFNTSKSLDRNIRDIQRDTVLKERLDFRIADLIEKGRCLIYNKAKKAFEQDILIVYYRKNYWSGILIKTASGQLVMDVVTGAF